MRNQSEAPNLSNMKVRLDPQLKLVETDRGAVIFYAFRIAYDPP